MTCDVEVNDRPSMVPENYEADEDAEVQGDEGEEVDRRNLTGVVLQEDAPPLRGGGVRPRTMYLATVSSPTS